MKSIRRDRVALLIPCLLLAVLLPLLGGCGDEDPAVVKEEDDPEPLPADPDALVAAFTTAYEAMDLDAFTRLLHPQFEMLLTARLLQDWDWPVGTTFDRDEIQTIHDHIFSGASGHDAQTNAVKPIDAITVDLFERVGSWTAITAETPDFSEYTEGFWCWHNIMIRFHNNEDNHNFEVQESVVVYAIPVTQGEETGYQFLGWNDTGNYRKTDQTTWGDVLSLYLGE